MPGRLDQYDDFAETTQYEVERKKPMRRDDDEGETRKSLDTVTPDILLTKSRDDHTILEIFYTEMRKDGIMSNVRRQVVVPGNRMTRYPKRTHIEVVDIHSLTRKVFRRDRIHDIKPTSKKFSKNPDVVGFRR